MLEITYRPLKGLVAYAKNSRVHSAASIAKIAGSLASFGWTNPMLVADSVMIAGHARLTASLEMAERGIPIPNNPDPWLGPTVDLSHLDKHQRAAYVIADNRLALDAGWDNELLAEELGWLAESGFDLSITGWEVDELAGLLSGTAPGEGGDPDEVPETPIHPVSEPGDVWLLGDGHRLMCGDSTKPEDVAKLMAGRLADICFTSPPYGMQRNSNAGGVDNWSEWTALMQGVFDCLPMNQKAQVLVNLGLVHRNGEWSPYWDSWIDWMRSVGWRRFGWYVWDQGWGLPGDWNGRLAPSHEFIFHFNREAETARKSKKSKNAGKIHTGNGLRGKNGVVQKSTVHGKPYQATKVPDSVIRIPRQVGSVSVDLDHPAVFPVALVAEMLAAFSDPGDLVYEPFSGSGTQIIGAQNNDRICYGMEVSPPFVDVSVRRWQLVFGTDAILESDGRPFNDVAFSRPFGEAAEVEAAIAEEQIKPRRRRKQVAA